MAETRDRGRLGSALALLRDPRVIVALVLVAAVAAFLAGRIWLAADASDGDAFPWSYDLPADPALERSVILGSEMWIAGTGETLRGVSMGEIDLGSEAVTLPAAGQRLRGELGMIPGGNGTSEPEPVRLAVGDALGVRVEVGATAFFGYAMVVDGVAYRLVVVGYPEAEALAVAMSLRFDSR